MNRREFTGMVAAGALFPVELVKALGSSPKGYKEYAAYPLYYFPVRGNDVFRLWVPEEKSSGGFVLSFPSPLPHKYLFTVMSIGSPPSPDSKSGAVPWRPHRLFSTHTPGTLATAPSSSFIQASRHAFDSKGKMLPTHLEDDVGVPYLGTGDFWHHKDGPIIFGNPTICKTWESYGYLVRAKPFCTFSEFVVDGVR